MNFYRKYLIPVFFICVSLISWTGKADINSIEIRVLPESVVYDEYYSLGDIAELDGFDIETIQKLAKLKIGKSPLPGRSLFVSHGKIRRVLNGSKIKRDFKLNFPSRPVVSRASIKITQQQLEELAYSVIKKEYQEYENVKITVRSKFRDLYLPKGKVTYETERIGNRGQLGGYLTWSLSLQLNGEEFKKLYVKAKVEVFDEVVVATKRITRGEKIAKEDLTSITKNISNAKIGYQSKQKLVVGQQAKRDIFVNETVSNGLVEQPILIKKGTPVKLIYKTKSMVLTNIVKALKPGKKGEIIPVRPLTGQSTKTIYAVVVDSNSVEVAL